MTKLPRVLDSSLNELRRLHPISTSISEEITPLSTATVVLPENETVSARGWVELYTPNGSAGIYRAGMPQEGYGGKTNSIGLEHGLCEIGESIVKANIAATEKTLSQAISQVFAYYIGNRWQIGSVISGNVKLETKYGDNLLTCIISLVDQIPSYMISCNFSTSPWTLNVVSRDTSVSAEGRLSRNVSSATVTRDDRDLCTRVYMEGLGASGAIGYMDADTVSTYGVIEKKITGSEDYTQVQAQAVATSYLNKCKRPRYSVTVNAVDFSRITGETLDRVAVGKKYRLAIPSASETIEETIIRIQWGNVYDDRGDVTLFLAEEEKTLVSFLQQTTGDIYNSYTEVNNLIMKKDQEYWTKFEITDQAILAEATRAREEEGKRIAKTTDFDTVEKILNDAHAAADAAAVSAKNASIAKTQTYQTAEAIVTAAVTTGQTQGDGRWIRQTTTIQTADALINTAVAQGQTAGDGRYLRQTQVYQTADAIVSTAKNYTDTQKQSIESSITQMYNKISLVVSDNNTIDAASIVAAINGSGSLVSISASKIDLTGHVSITQLSEWKTNTQIGAALDVNGGVIASSVKAGTLIADNNCVLLGWQVSWQSITINGTSYRLAVGS